MPEALVPADATSRAIRHALRRLVPFLMLMFVVSFLDRANVAFAKQALAATEGISEQIYALGAGLFFLSYSTCGFPSNLILHRIGARRWLSTLLIAWGLVSTSTMFVTGPESFYALRLLLGATEAGFFPGVILYLTYWFPNRVRGRMMGLFYLGVPLALILGGPLSGFLLDLHGRGGLQGWQWMFLVEGLLAVGVGFAAFALLEDKPVEAAWLPGDEKRALVEELASEEHARRSAGPVELLPMLRDPRVLRFLLIYALIQTSTYGVVFYLPAEVAGLLHRPAGFIVGLVSAIPWICALAAVYFLPHTADARCNHRRVAALTLLIAGVASLVFPTAGPVVGLIALSVAASGFVAVQPVFWTFPTSYLAGRAAAGGIALIGAGNLGGFFAPNLKVWADRAFHSQTAGLYLLAGLTLVNAGLIATMRNAPGDR
ncbi:MFS transporter [Occallatibacter riparius]|uniref:MFS transporter n=1 Tax=Occallatibacter riparius TaxID=1002689 RepID=A0A9J7BIY8_9BACT|nr:MFS transporter [Occallatibacter riparius]UWZ82449.1 MFS transporter [Occallatibacter riparius]